jgi:hypothetical protein
MNNARTGENYTGQWHLGDRSGQGTYVFANGDMYVGSWKKNVCSGRGVYTYKETGNYYSGVTIHHHINTSSYTHIIIHTHTLQMWADDMKNGKGKFQFSTGR